MELPKHDLLPALALSLAWHRYRKAKLDDELQRSQGGYYIRAVLEHVVRLRRFSEGLTAFATTGVNTEVQWLSRPCIELFTSQSILQFVDLNWPSGGVLSKEEKGESYFTHGECVQLDILKNHGAFPGTPATPAERQAKIDELELKLKVSPFKHKASGEWHGMSTSEADRRGLETAGTSLSEPNLKEALGITPALRAIANKGIHGHSFAGRFLRVVNASGGIDVADERIVKTPEPWILPCYLAKLSVEMLASEFGQRSLVQGMVRAAEKEITADPDRFIGMFPTALMDLRG